MNESNKLEGIHLNEKGPRQQSAILGDLNVNLQNMNGYFVGWSV